MALQVGKERHWGGEVDGHPAQVLQTSGAWSQLPPAKGNRSRSTESKQRVCVQ